MANAKISPPSKFRLLFLKLVLLITLVLSTNPGSWSHSVQLLGKHQWGTLLPYIAIWVVAIMSLGVAAFHAKISVRLVWGAMIAASTAATWGYYQASGSELSLLDMMSLWTSRHEAGRAATQFAHQFNFAGLMFLACLFLFLLPSPILKLRFQRWLRRLVLVPLLPVIMIIAVFWVKHGTSYIPMPSQFNSVSLASLMAYKISTEVIPERLGVAWVPTAAKPSKNLILLVDESLRSDYIDLTFGNSFTPKFAQLADKFVNFSPAISGGDCSNYSNAALRFGVSRKNIISSAQSNATLFAYAKKAGFRTVFIDAQAHNISGGDFLQNFMTMRERSEIDAFYPIKDIPSYQSDAELARLIGQELKRPEPVFIYANKNGTHFPYDEAYPATAAKFHPTISESSDDTVASRVASYRNAVAWSVDDFMENFFAKNDLSNTTMIYTSDHGQQFVPGQVTHCQVENPPPRVALVPLMVYTADADVRSKLEKGAAALHHKSSHFQIAPTLYSLMGYSSADIAKSYDEDLFKGTSRPTELTTGDIFGVIGNKVNVMTIDSNPDYLELKP